jgi:DNA topoisomerase-2
MTTSLSQKYQQKTDKQHILDNPDTYIGSVEKVDAQLWIFNDDSQSIVLKDIEYVPGLYKLFDEGIVNARDHVIRMIQLSTKNTKTKVVSYIDTTISNDGTITITNDGNGIDIEKHPENGLWIPEMIFGHLRTSTNYDKDEKKIVGGKNGFGFKLVLIWSSYGYIETVDHTRGLKYTQEFKNNLDELCVPKITKYTGKPYTTVVFKPDYKRLHMDGLTSDMLALLKKRVYDIGAVTDQTVKKVKINYNGQLVPVKNFQQYIDLYLGVKDSSKEETKRVYESMDDRWEYAVGLSSTHEFIQVSFVNGICTNKGGKHVDYIMGQICRKLVDYIEKKKKIRVNPSSIKEQLILFLRCDIENPSFDSQTKDFMNTPSSKFGSSCSVSDIFIEKVAKMGVMSVACSLTEAKDNKLAKKTDGSKTKSVRGIQNLIDANLSGSDKSKDCILILCEGLSAMSGIVSGLSSTDRNTIGIYPLKGKVLNVRGEKSAKINENKEIAAIKKILGLESGRTYTSIDDVNKSLRYGRIMVMTDQDLDGSHIKGLCINLFHSEWESLTRIPGFLCFMNTPILRAEKGDKTVLFYNDGEYDTWKQSFGTDGNHGWTIKYFKGLGTSTSVEFKQYFANKKIVGFIHKGSVSDDSIDKVFNKKRPDDRKTWLENYDKTSYLDTTHPEVSYEDFFDKEMIHFSKYDCERSIPNMVDGLKTSQRKVLFAAFKRNMIKEIKVAQFSGYVSEHSVYHHGEASLNGAIVKMAQNFVGSNNIHLLQPNGQFGTRLQGGDDAASERYIFTQLNPLARILFPTSDDSVLSYINDDGIRVEPEYYVPIIPFCLVNGISGIGTGFSSDIPSYDPKILVKYLRAKLSYENTEHIEFLPYYEGFKGTVTKVIDNKFTIRGNYEKIGEDKIRITELPVGTWTMPYLKYLEDLLDGGVGKDGKKINPILKDVTNLSTELVVDINIQFTKGKLETVDIETLLKLTSNISTTNMHLFDADCKLHKYLSIPDIIDDFFVTRIDIFKKRKDAQISSMRSLLIKLSNRARYILDILSGIVDLRKKTNNQVTELLNGLNYDTIEGDYKYLIKMPMDSVTEEHVLKIMNEKAETESEIETLLAKPIEKIWLDELNLFEIEYNSFIQKHNNPFVKKQNKK